jgi:hypothetical protein
VRKICLLYGLLLLSDVIFSQSSRKPIAASYLSLGAYSTHHVDVFSVCENIASLTQIKNPAFGVYGEKRFLLAETNMYSAIFALPTKDGNFAFQADYFGFKNYNESQLGIAYSRNVGSKLDLGIKFNYYSFRIPGYENPSTVNFEIGAIFHLNQKLNAGIHFYNPVGGKLSKSENDKLASVYSFGLGYEASDNFLLAIELEKQQDVPVNVNAAIQYDFAKKFFARFGVATENETPFAGAGVSWNNFRVDVSASYHPQLGLTPGLLFILNLKAKQDDSN